MRRLSKQRSALQFALLTSVGFLFLFFIVRIYIIGFRQNAESFPFLEVMAGYLEDVFVASLFGLLTLWALSLKRKAVFISVIFPLELIVVIICYANLQYINFFGERLRLFDFEYVRNIGSTWRTTLFNDLWIQPGELLILIIPLSAVIFGLVVVTKTTFIRASKRKLWAASGTFLAISLLTWGVGAFLKRGTDMGAYHQSNFFAGFLRDIPRLEAYIKATRQLKSESLEGEGAKVEKTSSLPPELAALGHPAALPNDYVWYNENYPFIKIPKKDAQRMGLIPKTDDLSECNPAKKRAELRNIVFIVLESFRCKEMGFYGSAHSLAPNLDSLALKSTVFKDFYGHYDMTAEAEFTMMNSFYDVFKGVATMRRHYRTPLFSLPEILGLFGYTNYWINSWSADFDNSRIYFERHGDFKMIDKESFPKTAVKAGWSYSDEDTMKLAAETLDKAKEPFFTILLTATNHIPYEVPDKKFELGLESGIFGKYLNTYYYTDYAVGRFFDLIRDKEYFKNTVFFIFADTGNNRKPENKKNQDFVATLENLYRIPLLIYDPAREQGRVVEEIAGQIDIAPTVLDMLGITVANPFVGQSLLRERTSAFYLAYHGRDIPWVNYIDSSLYCRYNVETGRFQAYDRKLKQMRKIAPIRRQNIISDILRQLKLGDWSIYNDRVWDRKLDEFYASRYKKK